MHWEITVGMATPSTPMWKMMTKIKFKMTLTTPAMNRKYRGRWVSPTARQDGRAKVVEHHHRHADKIDAHVQHRLADHIFGGAHHLQQGPGKGNAQKDQHHAANQADQHRRVHRLVQVLALARPIVPGHQHVDADGEADEQVDNQLDESAGRTHRRQGLRAHKLPHHNDVRRVEQQLQNARKGQRDGKPDGFSPPGGPLVMSISKELRCAPGRKGSFTSLNPPNSFFPEISPAARCHSRAAGETPSFQGILIILLPRPGCKALFFRNVARWTMRKHTPSHRAARPR